MSQQKMTGMSQWKKTGIYMHQCAPSAFDWMAHIYASIITLGIWIYDTYIHQSAVPQRY